MRACVRAWVELGWVGLCFADRIRQDGVRNAKYSLGMGAGTADRAARRARATRRGETTMSPVCTGRTGTGYDRAGQGRAEQSRAEQQKGGCKVAGHAKWEEWERLAPSFVHGRPYQTRPVRLFGSFAHGDFVTLCCTLTARGSSQQPTAQQPDEMDQPDLQQSQ